MHITVAAGGVRRRCVADQRLAARRRGYVDLHDAQHFAGAVEHLDAGITAVADIDVALGVRGDGMRRIHLARLGTAVAPLHQPIAVLVIFGDARIDVAVADIGVAGRIPRHIGDLPEQAVYGR